MNDNLHVERRFKVEVAPWDLAFIKGLPTIAGDNGVAFNVKIPKGQVYILHSSDHTIPIINHEDRWSMAHLYAVNVAIISGYQGVYADDESEAYDILADYSAEIVDDPANPGQTKYRWPGLIGTWNEVMNEYDQDEVAAQDFTTGPFGNESWYFYSDGNGISAEEVPDPRIPPIPDDLFPFSDDWTLLDFLELKFEKETPADFIRRDTLYRLRVRIDQKYGMPPESKEWAGWLSEYVYDHPDEFPVEIEVHLRDDGEYDLKTTVTCITGQ